MKSEKRLLLKKAFFLFLIVLGMLYIFVDSHETTHALICKYYNAEVVEQHTIIDPHTTCNFEHLDVETQQKIMQLQALQDILTASIGLPLLFIAVILLIKNEGGVE